MDGWTDGQMDKSSGFPGCSQLMEYFCSFAARLVLGQTPAMLPNNFNPAVSAG